jgi:hypothetical protein
MLLQTYKTDWTWKFLRRFCVWSDAKREKKKYNFKPEISKKYNIRIKEFKVQSSRAARVSTL